jgi:molybdopterin molybdotransferase
MTAGSSVGTRDLTRDTISKLGEPGILQHGLAVKPGKPTIIAVCAGKPVIGLPGNPVSAFLVGRQILLPIIQRLLGERAPRQPSVLATLASNIPSTTGREDTIPVHLADNNGELTAAPVFGKSNLIYTLVHADGLLTIPLNSNGLKAGTKVQVFLF